MANKKASSSAAPATETYPLFFCPGDEKLGGCLFKTNDEAEAIQHLRKTTHHVHVKVGPGSFQMLPDKLTIVGGKTHYDPNK